MVVEVVGSGAGLGGEEGEVEAAGEGVKPPGSLEICPGGYRYHANHGVAGLQGTTKNIYLKYTIVDLKHAKDLLRSLVESDLSSYPKNTYYSGN